MAISFTVLGAVVVLFVWNRIPVELVAVGAALSLYGTGVLDLPSGRPGSCGQTQPRWSISCGPVQLEWTKLRRSVYSGRPGSIGAPLS
jgi:hypothetical protein